MSSFCDFLPKDVRVRPRKAGKKREPSQTPTRSFVSIGASSSSSPSRSTPSRSTQRQARHASPHWFERGAKAIEINPKEFNIFYIDSHIRTTLQKDISTVSELVADLKRIEEIQKTGDPYEQCSARRQGQMMRRRIRDLENTLELTFYILQTTELLNEYRKLIRQAGPRSFVAHKADRGLEDRKTRLVTRYLSVASQYVKLSGMEVPPQKLRCSSCDSEHLSLEANEDSIYICHDCSAETEILDASPSFKDTDRVDMSGKYMYTRRHHFVDAYKRFCGTQNIDPAKIQRGVTILLNMMEEHNLVADQEAENCLTKDLLYDFLSSSGLSAHYADINLLWHIITGEKCPKISHMFSYVMEDFDKQEEALLQDKDDARVNSLSVNYKLYKLLQRRGYECRKGDFYVLRTPSKVLEHDEKMKKAWKRINWPWIATF